MGRYPRLWSGHISSLTSPNITASSPDLPSHGPDSTPSSHNASLEHTFSIPRSSDPLADLICKHARNGQAHVIGLSLGGYNALHLAAHQPSIVLSVFASGSSLRVDINKVPTIVLVGTFSVSMTLIHWMPKTWFLKGCGWQNCNIPDELYETPLVTSRRKGIGSAIMGSLVNESGPKVLGKIQARTAIIAGAKQDDLKATREAGKGITADGSVVCVVKHVGHAWDLEDPVLFARGVDA